MEPLASWDNLQLAYRRASKGKRGSLDAAAFDHRVEDNVLQLAHELSSQLYRPGGYHSFFIHDPKRRLISAAPFRDRVVHHALCNLIEPRFERSFITDSYANRMGKGTHAARARCQQYARRFRYVWQADVRQFFPSVDHQILRCALARKVNDPHLIWLIDLILDGGKEVLKAQYDMVYFADDDLFAINRPRGLPIGNLTSQFWANVYMNPFDHFVKRELRCHGYVRYVDDFLLFADNKKTLWHWKTAAIERLALLRLTIHDGTHPRPVTEGIPFLGFQIFPDRMRLKRRNGVQYQQKFHRLLAQYAKGEINLEQVTASVRGWANHARWGNTVGLRKAVLMNTLVPKSGSLPKE